MVMAALGAWIRQRARLDFANYGDVTTYRSEQRSITRDRHDADALLRYVEWHDSITGEMVVEASKHAFSGRLTITPQDNGGVQIDYCAGQYWPTEYRKAVCAVLASCIWYYWRGNMPAPAKASDGSEVYGPLRLCAGDYLRGVARREFQRGICSRWFS